MAAQQVQIAETIRAMKLALKRKSDDSDSDDEYYTQTNRGTKLRKSARRRITHAGYTRAIICTNPNIYDSEGEPVSPNSSNDERLLESKASNPFGGTQLETLLKPLTTLEELADHPSLGYAYRNTALARLSSEAAQMLRKERENLWRAKRLLKRFEGDADWVPCVTFEAEGDATLLYPTNEVSHSDDGKRLTAEELARDVLDRGTSAAVNDEMMLDIVKSEEGSIEMAPNGETILLQAGEDRRASADPDSETASTAASNMHAMTTRARARSPQRSASASPSPSDSASVPVINPWFITPSVSLPDRDLGLPADEAETTRKMLLLYCQKQEQIIRSLDLLYSGLQKGDRLRKSVLASAKAAGHLVLDGKNGLVTDMSDGEDWYDQLEHGRLEKGKDEIEDIEEEGRRGGRRRRVVGRV